MDPEGPESSRPVLRFDGCRLAGSERKPVREFPIALNVNGVSPVLRAA